ncbi:hypothetical protein SUGI_0293070 [Cryptomeria japonica]|uniref:UDP-glucose:glycoprotein glucosyltransferase n=1 Tax=Cryptomeria japonica TaxID=3369 RepID=UPI002408B097|nr:UDP-glucose:glycoprotein glucosyltransferase [Cryptomeria japonica]GLJ16960.1 hypothetical protein SUGI_0293070 [Cryptomeria japonica]
MQGFMKRMGQSNVSGFLIILAIVIGICGVAESRHPQPKNVQVSLRAKWSGTPLLLEAGELLANERKDLYWEFVRFWLESDHHLAATNAKDCFQEILKHGSFLLSRALGSFFEFALILRSASPKLVLYRQLAQESISSFFLSQEKEGNKNISYSDMEKEFDRWELNRNPNAPDGKCCWVDLGSTILFDVSELSAWLSIPKTLEDLTEEPEIFDFDHIYPESNKRSPIAILYGALGSSCFLNFHRILAEASRKGEVQYIVRPVIPSGCESKAEYCSAVGTGNIVNLGGYGVELALKNMEYKAIDDSEVKKGVILEDPKTEELSQEVRGFIFSKLLERKPELASDVMAFRDYLLSSSVSDTLEVWELKDLGYQSAQRIVQASDPLHTMQEINQNFPNLVSSLSRMKLNQSIKDEIAANQRMVPPGKCLMAINGALISTDSIDLFSLLELIHGELSLADRMANVTVPQTAIKSLLHTHAPPEQSSLRVDFRSIHVHYLNNIEEDSMYRRWRSNLNELLMPVFPGQLHYIRKNLYHAVYVIDPSTGAGLKVVNSILYMFENNVPMRFGIILFSSKLAATIEENDGEIPEYFDKEQRIGHMNDGDDTSSFMISLFLYIKENYGIKMAFQFLSSVNNLWDANDDEVVEIGDVEQAFVETIQSKADSPPQNILLSLENEVKFKSLAYQSTLFVFKLGLSKIQSCLLMNGLVYPSSQEPDSAIQAMNEELVKIQEGIYYGQIGSNTDILEKFLLESGHPRYNPQIIHSGKGHQKFVSLSASVAKKDSVIMKLQYLHSPETENDVKPITHLLAVDLTSKRGLKFLRNGIRYLLDGSKRARVGVLYNMDNLDSFSEQSPPLLLMKVIDFSVFSVRDRAKALHFLNQLIIWYESQHISSSEESDPSIGTFIEEVSKLAESSDLKFENLRSELSAGTWDLLSCKYYLQKVSRFLSLEFGLKPGDNAVITNGRVVLLGEQSFFSDDLKLLEAVEYDRRIKHIATIIEKVDWVGVEPDEITSDFISDRIMAISSAMAARSRSSDVARFEILSAEHSAIVKGREDANVHIDAVIDPLSSSGQKIAPLLRLLEKWFQPSLRIIMNPMSSLADLPLKNFYRYVAPTKNDFSGESSLINGPTAWFSNMPLSKTLTMNLDVPEPWLVEPVIAIHDLDNIVLENLGDARTLQAVFELEAIVLTGHCSEKDHDPPRGLQLLLGTKQKQHMVDTIVMANLGYWQLKAAPGVWTLSLAPGRSADLYTLEGPHEGTEEGPMKKLIVIDDLGAQLVRLEVVRKKGKEKENLLSAADDIDDNGHSEGGEQMKRKGWKKGLLKWASGLIGGEGNDKGDKDSNVHREIGRHGDTINIFSVASGHLYERFLKIMILSVLKNTNRPVKFWFIKNYLSPQFKDVIPHMAHEYGFEYELITYKWPTWLHKQTEKQRIIWAYKILFLDVIFPLSLKKVIFVDADQIVRADMGELYDMDIKGRPLAYTPFCDNNKEMDGYRFWRQGFWKDHLRGRPYHISALYVVDLAKFRQTASGDTLRVFYETLSKDPNSLSNLDQDLPNYAQQTVPIFSLPQEWLWCESWCGNATKSKSKTIDLCNNPMTKEPKLQGARRIVAEWPSLDEEARKFTAKILGEEIGSQIEEPQPASPPQDSSSDDDHDEL